MKSLLVFLRIIIVGILWGIVFTEGLRVIMLCNWHFDIFWPDHWRQAKALWKAGWVVRAPKEWAFVLLIITYVPMLLTGWWTLCLVAWEELIWKTITYPYHLCRKFLNNPLKPGITNNHYGVVKRKSYKQIRPAGINTIRVPISDYGDNSEVVSSASAVSPAYSGYSASSLSSAGARTANKVKKTDVAATIDHALFKFDDDDDDDFDLDIDSFEKTDLKKKPKEEKKPLPKFDFDDDGNNDNGEEETEKNKRSRRSDKHENIEKRITHSEKSEKRPENRKNENKSRAETSLRSSQGPVYEALQQKNYQIINNVAVGNTIIDFVGVSDEKICLCLVDKENGDWLADEEMFNGEEPLWFSENSHRISPVCLLNNARNKIKNMLEDADFEQTVEAFVVIQMANIINADDMFETWNDMDINVTRINRGAPKEIKLFSKTLSEAENSISKKDLDKLTQILKKNKQ